MVCDDPSCDVVMHFDETFIHRGHHYCEYCYDQYLMDERQDAEEVQEFNSVVMAPKGWNKAGITEKVMMREVMMQEARLQDALLELETNIRIGLISEKQAMAMFAKLIG